MAEWSNLILAAVGGGGLTSIVLAIVNKIRNKGEITRDRDNHLKQLSEILSGTIKDVQGIYQESIKDLRSDIEHANKLTESSHIREDRLLDMLEQSRKYNDILEDKNRNKNKIIHSARKCELLKGHSEEECIVLHNYDEYSSCKEDCKLKAKNDADNKKLQTK